MYFYVNDTHIPQITVLKDNVLPISIAMLGLTFASRLAYLKIKSR